VVGLKQVITLAITVLGSHHVQCNLGFRFWLVNLIEYWFDFEFRYFPFVFII